MRTLNTKEDILLRKIGKRKEEIHGYIASNITPITDVVYRETNDYERYEDAVRATDYKPISAGEWWGGGKNGWFKVKFSVPREWKGREVAGFFKLGGEACAFLDGKPYQGIDRFHEELLLLQEAEGGERFDFVIDAASSAPWNPEETRKVQFERADVGTIIPEVREYWYNLDVLHLLALDLPQDSARRAKIIHMLNESVDAFDYTHTDEESLRQSALRANEVLMPLLECKADASTLKVAAIGHSHIDTGWLWPYRETRRKCSRTFSTVTRLMERYPEYLFSQGQPQLYEFTKKTYASLYEEIKKLAADGRWEITGSMWVESDCNVPSGESLVRQILVGKNFFKDEFGVETDVLWLPDVFGYSAALPQILKKSGVNYFSTVKINWSQFNRFPYSTFYWKGIDGTEVLSHFMPTVDYNMMPDPHNVRALASHFREKDRSEEFLMSYGHGDGGGGPERRHLELLRRFEDLEGMPKCRQKSISEFFHGIDNGSDYPRWVGELYLEYHRGTYTTQSYTKRCNRKGELLFRDAELLSSIAKPLGLEYPYEELLEQWKQLLCNQFHDVLPGSSIRQVYEDTDEMYAEILAVGGRVANRALATIADSIDTTGEGDAIVVFNTLPWNRADLVSVDLPGDGEYAVLDCSGKEVPSQIESGRISFAANVPSMGYSTYRLLNRRPTGAESQVKVGKGGFENRFYRMKLDGDGVISSIIHKQTGREVLPSGARANLLQLFEDKSNHPDAWDIDIFYDDKFDDLTGLKSLDVVADGPVYAAIEIDREFNGSKLRQRITVYSDNPRIDFHTRVDWHESRKCLKASFPVDVNTSEARYEIQFGNITRPTHTNTSWDWAKFEVCGHKWADLSETGFGVSLMNDCKYGYHTKGNTMRLTLLRSPKYPDPMADMGEQEFIYSLMPHQGSYVEGGTVREAYALNVPLTAVVVAPSSGDMPKEKSFFSVDAGNVILETVKKAEREDATILRLYECHNMRSNVTVKADLPFKTVYECNLMEENMRELKSEDGGFSFEIKPFEIRSFKLV